jgi:peptidoglycan/xylan/chitin deacetylase (PgdA/CDA1 family)
MRRLKILFIAATFVAIFFVVPSTAAAARTVVSLTFDDGDATEAVAGPMLAAHGMHGTFYVNSDTVGTSGHLTWGQLSDLYAGGNEIGGHTLDHVDLTTVSLDEAQRQVCDDRRQIWAHGLPATDFAYPYGARNSSLYPIIQNCGYNSARRSWGLCWPLDPPGDCAYWGDPYAETIPPSNPWEIRTQSSITFSITVDTLEEMVTNAENAGGGWVTLVFHDVCDSCSPDGYGTSPSTFQAFLDWLQPRSANGTIVQTVAQVIGGPTTPPPSTTDTTPPVSSIACNGGTCGSGWYSAPVSVSLSATDTQSGVAVIRYTTDGSTPTVTSPVYSGPFTVSATTTVKYRAWDNANNVEPTNSQLVRIDLAAPTAAVTAPATGATVSGTVQLQATASDTGSGVARVEFYVDGTLQGTSTSAPYKVAWNTRKASKGTHTITAVAVDNAGNRGTSAAITVTVQ